MRKWVFVFFSYYEYRNPKLPKFFVNTTKSGISLRNSEPSGEACRFTEEELVQTSRDRRLPRRMLQQKAVIRAALQYMRHRSTMCPCPLVRDIKGDFKARLPLRQRAKQELPAPSRTLRTVLSLSLTHPIAHHTKTSKHSRARKVVQ